MLDGRTKRKAFRRFDKMNALQGYNHRDDQSDGHVVLKNGPTRLMLTPPTQHVAIVLAVESCLAKNYLEA